MTLDPHPLIPYELTEFDDPLPDDDIADAAFDVHRERQAAGEERLVFGEEEWDRIAGASRFDRAKRR